MTGSAGVLDLLWLAADELAARKIMSRWEGAGWCVGDFRRKDDARRDDGITRYSPCHSNHFCHCSGSAPRVLRIKVPSGNTFDFGVRFFNSNLWST